LQEIKEQDEFLGRKSSTESTFTKKRISILSPRLPVVSVADCVTKQVKDGTLRYLPICGHKEVTKGFSRFEWHSKLDAGKTRVVTTLQYWVGGSICALRLIMSDGSKSPKFGGFHPLDKSVSLAQSDKVKYVQMRGDTNFVQSLQMMDAKMNVLAKLEGSFTTGKTQTYELSEDEQIVGCYGVYNY
jgi:hypothetical protein